jgi:hypothetical protein
MTTNKMEFRLRPGRNGNLPPAPPAPNRASANKMKFRLDLEETAPGYYEFEFRWYGSKDPIIRGADSNLDAILKSIGAQIAGRTKPQNAAIADGATVAVKVHYAGADGICRRYRTVYRRASRYQRLGDRETALVRIGGRQVFVSRYPNTHWTVDL